MAKFSGKIGYAQTTETAPGVHEETFVERVYSGDILQNRRLLHESADGVNPGVSLGNSISIVADAFAFEQYFAIRYAELAGVKWTVQDVEVQRPRLLLRLGEVWNG